MRALGFVVLLFLVGVVGVGFYRGWFQLSANNTGDKPSATVTVDKVKIHADEQNYDNQSQPAARAIAPASAVRPGGQRAQKHQNQNHNQNGAKHLSSP